MVLLLLAIYFYNRRDIHDWSRHFAFYLILGIFYIITTLSTLYLVFTLIENRKNKRKRLALSEIEEGIFLEIEGMINYYLKENEGKAYTAKTLIKKLENYLIDKKKNEYFRNNIEDILVRMVQRGTIQSIEKSEGIRYYL
jgi:hypothetical protein